MRLPCPCVFDQYELSTVHGQRLELQRLDHELHLKQIELQRQIELAKHLEGQLGEKTQECAALSSQVNHLISSGEVPMRNIIRSIPRRLRRRILRR